MLFIFIIFENKKLKKKINNYFLSLNILIQKTQNGFKVIKNTGN